MSSVQPFHTFGRPHIAALVVIAVILFSLVLTGIASRKRCQHNWDANMLALLLALNEAWWITHDALAHNLTLANSLPLHLCSVSIWTVILALLTRNQLLFEWSYFFGVGGAVQALITPEITNEFPDPYFVKFFISHGGILAGVVLLTARYGKRPTWRSVWRMMVIGTIYIVVVGGFNLLAGTNYGYLRHKPEAHSLLDYLGPWPWYVLGIEGVGAVTILALYLPYAMVDLLRPRKYAGTHV